MKLDKKGSIDEKTIEKYIILFVLLLVLFKVIAQIFPDVGTSASELNDSGFPLASLFMSGGALWYLVAVALLIAVYRSFSNKSKK